MMIGIDVGGTFTDLVAADPVRGVRFVKTPSTPEDSSRGVVDALELLATELNLTLPAILEQTTLFIHGTTVATNTLVQRRGARLGLITTLGFRDLLELRDGARRDRYRLRRSPPEPLVARPLRAEVSERLDATGQVVLPLEEDDVRAAIAELRRAGAEAVVVCLLHSYRNPAHEERIREILLEEGSRTGWRPYVSLSHEVLSCQGEFDRLSTTVLNAYLGPGLRSYLDRLVGRLTERGIRVPVLVMQSNGGVLPAVQAGARAVGAVTSGPAGGAKAAALFSRELGLPHLVAYDTGGTTTDVSLIDAGQPLERTLVELEEMRIVAPSIDVNPIGIGGGSIARIDNSGILSVGPQSAGATPGPACFGKGGTRATLTDANLVLGLLAPDNFLGGRMRLDPGQARQAIAAHVADPLGISVEEAAWAVHALASVGITEGIRLATVRRGLDPRDFALMPFGGAGGLHAHAVARELSIPLAVIPKMGSVLSALGFLAADMRWDVQRSIGRPIASLTAAELAQCLEELGTAGQGALGSGAGEQAEASVIAFADCRYARQVQTIPVPLLPADTPEALEDRFVSEYMRQFQHVHPGDPGVVETIRLSVLRELPRLHLPRRRTASTRTAAAACTGRRRVYLGRSVEAEIYRFEALEPGMQVAGPALVESSSTTILIQEGGLITLDDTLTLHLTEGGA